MNRLWFSLAIGAVCISVSAKSSITIKSTVKNDSVYFISYDMQQLASGDIPEEKQSVVLKKGKAVIPVPSSGAIFDIWGPGLMDGYCGPVFVAPDTKLVINVKGPDRANMTISGSDLAKDILTIENQGDSLQAVIRSLSEVDKVAFDSVYTKWRTRYDKALSSHLYDDFGIYCLDKATIDGMNKYFDSIAIPKRGSFMEPLYQKSKNTVERYRERMAAKEKITIGADAPEFVLPDMDGKLVSLSSFRGKWVLLDFWGSWCRWCMVGVPQMKENYAKFSNKCEFIGIDCNDSKADWIKCVKDNEMNWVQLYNEPETGKPASIIYGVSGYPTKILIDPEGQIVKICVGEDKTFYDDFSTLMN